MKANANSLADLQLTALGVAARTTAEWWARTARIAFEAGDSQTAFDRTYRLAEVCDEHDLKDHVSWIHIMDALLSAARGAHLVSRVRPLITRFQGRWKPEELAVFGDTTFGVEDARFVTELGEALVTDFPSSGRSWYLLGLGHELAGALVSAGDSFARCAQSEVPQVARDHATFRAGLCYGRDKRGAHQASALLKSLDRSKLSHQELLQYVKILAQSPKWLDRVRAMDTLYDLVIGANKNRGDFLDVEVGKLREYFLHEVLGSSLLPSPMEVDRLEGLIEVLYEGEVRVVAARQLENRVIRSTLAATALDDLGGAQLDDLPHTAVARFGALKGLEHHSTDLVAQLLSRLQNSAAVDWDEVLNTLKSAPAGELKPYVLVWASVLKNPDVDAEPAIIEWINQTPTLSVSMWKLASAFQGAKLKKAGAAAAERAIRDGVNETDKPLREAVIWRAVNLALRSSDMESLRFWLETANAEFS